MTSCLRVLNLTESVRHFSCLQRTASLCCFGKLVQMLPKVKRISNYTLCGEKYREFNGKVD